MDDRTQAPPFVYDESCGMPSWHRRIAEKRHKTEWRKYQIQCSKLLKKGLPIPPMPPQFQVAKPSGFEQLLTYPQIGPDSTVYVKKCDYEVERPDSDDEDSADSDVERINDSIVESENTDANSFATAQIAPINFFGTRRRLRSNVNQLRYQPWMPLNRINEPLKKFILNEEQYEFLTTDTVRLYVAASNIPGAGLGLFTASEIPPNMPVVEYFGHRMKIDVKQYQRIDAVKPMCGYTDDGVLLYPDQISKKYYAIYPAAHRESVSAAYFANYNRAANLFLQRVYTQDMQCQFAGVRRRSRQSNAQQQPASHIQPRFFLYSGEQPIPAHTELCWSYGLEDNDDPIRLGFVDVAPSDLAAGEERIDAYETYYVRNAFKAYIEKQMQLLQEQMVA